MNRFFKHQKRNPLVLFCQYCIPILISLYQSYKLKSSSLNSNDQGPTKFVLIMRCSNHEFVFADFSNSKRYHSWPMKVHFYLISYFTTQDMKLWNPNHCTAINSSKHIAVSIKDLQTNNRKTNADELVAIFVFWGNFWRLNYKYNNEITILNMMGSAETIIIWLN